MSKTPKNSKGAGSRGAGSGVPPDGFKSAQPHFWAAMAELRPALVNAALLLR